MHSNEELSKVDKFAYLKHYLEDSAKQVISGFQLTEKNYETALDLLKQRFAKPSMIKKGHIKDLINAPMVFSERNVSKMRELYDIIETHFRGLEALSVEQDSYSTIVVPTLMEKIPEPVRINMLRGTDNFDEWDIEALLQAFRKELNIREQNFSVIPENSSKQKGIDSEFRTRSSVKPQVTSASALLSGQDGSRKAKKVGVCIYCEEEHEETKCTKFPNVEERKDIILRTGRCFRCLNKGHRASQCYSKSKRKYCKKKHHTSLCMRNEPQAIMSVAKLSNLPQQVVSTTSCVENVELGVKSALQALILGRKRVRARVLFDTGSHRTFVTNEVVTKLGLSPVRQESLNIKTFGSNDVSESVRDIVELELLPINQGKSGVKVDAFVVDHISEVSNVHPEIVKHTFAQLTDLWFSDVSTSQESLVIDVLVGIDFFHTFQEDKVRRGDPGEPVAVKTKLGWVLSGPLRGERLVSYENMNMNLIVDNDISCNLVGTAQVEHEIHKLRDLETLGIKESDQVYDDLFDNVFFTGERYSVKLPWKVGHKPLSSNFALSLSRLKGQLRKLRKEPGVLQSYDQIIQEQLNSNIIEKVTELEMPEKQHILPHHAVIRNDAETTKIWIVFDASSKESRVGTSLNDCLHVGPPLTPLLFDILVRFREYKIPMIADIEKAFLNVEIDPSDRDVLRFLWVKDINDPNSLIEVYRFNRVAFGVNSSPFLLNAVLRYHINSYKDKDPEFALKLANSFYVDGLVCGADNLENAKELFTKSRERLKEGGLNLMTTKWKTSSRELQREFQIHEQQLQFRMVFLKFWV